MPWRFATLSKGNLLFSVLDGHLQRQKTKRTIFVSQKILVSDKKVFKVFISIIYILSILACVT